MPMGVKTLISEEEYLRMSFPDRAPEYVDGELVERNLPNTSHSRTQSRVTHRFETLGERLPLFPCPELRVRVAPGKYRIVDLAVYTAPEPVEQLPKQTPLIVVEIVSRRSPPARFYADRQSRIEMG